MPDWIGSTLLATPAFLWVYLGLGIPLALTLLPRTDWHNRPLVLMTAFAVGPGLLTAVMLALGSWNRPLLTLPVVFGALTVLTGFSVVMAVGVWHAKPRYAPTPSPDAQSKRMPLAADEWAVVALVVSAIVIRWIVTAWWPFTAYDALWVYGYEGRLYFLTGFIPPQIDYYPQFLPLQFTFGQLAARAVNDSAARAVIPLLHIGAVLAAYNLGDRLVSRRTGVYLAGLWALYPAVGNWARMGDLEVALAFLVTAAAVFFFRAWFGERPRHYAVIAGVLYGVALWAKPTAGAFALGVILLNALEGVRVRFDWQAYRSRFEVSAIMALACAPLGGVWYLRNIALGHNAVDFPPSYWHSLAERGGGQMLWYLAGVLLVAFVYLRQAERPHVPLVLSGLGLLLLGVVPSALARFVDASSHADLLRFYPSLEGLPRLGVFEGLLIASGGVLLAIEAVRYLRHVELPRPTAQVAWAVTATVPYFVVYFWLYSYHPRLSFAVVPLMALPIAAVLAYRLVTVPRWLTVGAFTLLALPGIAVPLYDPFLGWDYLWNADLPDDTAKRTSGNEALMWMVDGFWKYEQEHGEMPVVAAPGVQRLPFFMPLADVNIDSAPYRLDQLDGVTYFVDSHPDGTGAYERAGINPVDNQVLAALGRKDIIRRAWWKDDGIFRYEIYELFVDRRFEPKQPLAAVEDEIVFGGFARFVGHELSSSIFQIGQRRTVKFYWEVQAETDHDYMMYIHLRDADDNLQMAWDGPVALTESGRYYTTLVWEPGEYIVDERLVQLTNFDAPVSDGYSIVIGMYDLTTGQRVTITQDGEPIGDGYRLTEAITVTPPEPD